MPKMNLNEAMAVYDMEMADKRFLARDERRLNAAEIKAEFEKKESEDAARMAELTRLSDEYWYIHGLKAEWEAEAERMEEEEDRLAIEAFFASEEVSSAVIVPAVRSQRGDAYRRKQKYLHDERDRKIVKIARSNEAKRYERDSQAFVLVDGKMVLGKASRTMRTKVLEKKAIKRGLVEAVSA